MRCPVLLIMILASGFVAFAQTDRATVTGVVTDRPADAPDAPRRGYGRVLSVIPYRD